MANILSALGAAIKAARDGWTAARLERELRAAGMGARSSEVRALFKAALAIVSKNRDEPFKDLNSIPSGDELAPWPTRTATGVRQTVTLLYRDRTTGTVVSTYYSVTTTEPIARQTAVEQAISAYSDNAERYNQDLIGAVHSGAYRMVPTGEVGSSE